MDKIAVIIDYYGYNDEADLLESVGMDSIVPGICKNENCDFMSEVEPDCDSGYCEECETRTVQSVLVLLGVI